jgi:PelA/Pel-15E family pectate lyase
MSSPERKRRVAALILAVAMLPAGAVAQQASPAPAAPDRARVLDTMKRATTFMVETVSVQGGYVWNYLPDLSRRWGEMEARPTMIWIQPPGTATMGHLFLDAFHATGDDDYYRATEGVASALIWAQHPAGGWNYVADTAGEPSLRAWYDTVGKHGWRLEEFQHYWGNATFDDAGTAESARLLLRLYLEKRDPKYRPALDKAIGFVLDSQYPNGTWPQRFPLRHEFAKPGKPDYTSFPTFNDDVAAENIDFLLQCYQGLGDERLLDAVRRGMDAFLVTQQGRPQAGWGLQYSPELKPIGARTYEPTALVTHTTGANVGLLLRFFRLTGDKKYLARIPDALDWLDSVKLSPEVAAIAGGGRTHPTFVEIGTNDALYVHRSGSNVVNGRYYVDKNPQKTIGHYSAFRQVDTAGLRAQYEVAVKMSPEEAMKGSPLGTGGTGPAVPRYVTVAPPSAKAPAAAEVLGSLSERGFWLAPLGYNTHPYRGPAPTTIAAGDFSQGHVGDEFDTSPYPDPKLMGISVEAYIRNMGVLIRALGMP